MKKKILKKEIRHLHKKLEDASEIIDAAVTFYACHLSAKEPKQLLAATKHWIDKYEQFEVT